MKTRILFFLIYFFSFSDLLANDCGQNEIINDQFIIRWKESNNIGFNKINQSLDQLILSKGGSLSKIHSQKVNNINFTSNNKLQLNDRINISKLKLSKELILDVSKHDSVLSIENDCVVKLFSIPNDPSFSIQHSLTTSSIPSAWDISTNFNEIVVAVSDTGIDYTHPDLKNKMWKNTAELMGQTGIDDDGNGCVDDIYGCDFADLDGDPFPGVSTIRDHGTHIAGIIGAQTNNAIGISGIAQNVKLMAVKGFKDTSEGASLSDLLSTIYYSVNNGADIINCSWGVQATPSPSMVEAFNYARNNGVFVTVAAGNNGLDASLFAPASLNSVFTVGSINSNYTISTFSNHGNSVQIYAPGGDNESQGFGINQGIYSTISVGSGSYGNMEGTSMAAPHIAGIAALILSHNPSLSVPDLEDLLVNNSESFPQYYENRPASIKVVNAFNAMSAADQLLQDSNEDSDGDNDESNGNDCNSDCDSNSSQSNNNSNVEKTSCGFNKLDTGNKNASSRFWVLLFLPFTFYIFLRK